jgi:GAF domain-containing protein
MRRGPKPARSREAKPPAARKRPKEEGAKVRDLETRLAEASKREAEALAKLQARDRELVEAQEQQTATSEILRVISSSPTHLEPVYQTILSSVTRLCDASFAALFRYDGEVLTAAAHVNASPELAEHLARYRHRPSRETATRRAALERRTVHIHDVLADADYPPLAAVATEELRTVLAAPLLRQSTLVGVITTWRREVRPFSDEQVALVQTFADQAVIAIEDVRLFNETKAALERQTATSEILSVISSSPTDVQPVFDTITRNAVRLCGGLFGCLFRFDGERLHLVAHHNFTPEALALYGRIYPVPAAHDELLGPIVLEQRVMNVADVLQTVRRPLGQNLFGFRSGLGVPMVRHGVVIGAIAVSRTAVGLFPDAQVELLKTFADQAVIAIENVRLFKELEARNSALTESLEQQTATSEILRVISSSPTDLQPVMNAVAESAARLCEASDAHVFQKEGDLLRAIASHGALPLARQEIPMSRQSVIGRAVSDRRPIHVDDIGAALHEFPEAGRLKQMGYRTMLVTPLLREGEPIGAIVIRRTEVSPFSSGQMALLATFADQAVIAIENVRLFTELQEKNQALTQAHAQVTEALEQQTATAEILKVISSSPTDVRPVFDTIVQSAARLLDGHSANLLRVVENELQIAAMTAVSDAADAETRATFPVPVTEAGVATHVIRTRRPYIVADIETDPLATPRLRYTAPLRGFRSMLVVPMVHHDQVIGAITVTRRSPGAFGEDEIALLQTFADQAVIAIENVRLFRELEQRNRDLTEALDQQTATSEILRVIAGSPTDLQPVMDAVAESAARICGATDANIRRIEGDTLRLVARFGSLPVVLPDVYPISRDSPAGRAVVERRTIHIDDILPLIETEYPRLEGTTRRTFLTTPLMREGVPIGVILIRRTTVQPFSDKQIQLLETFADQAVIAIENVRLFTELQEKNRALTTAHAQVTETLDQQTATSDILRVISQSPTDVQPVFDAIAASVARLCDGFFSTVWRYDGTLIHHAADNYPTEEMRAILTKGYPAPAQRGSVVAEAISENRIIHVEDLLADSAPPASRVVAIALGYRTLLCVPMLRDGASIGAIAVARREQRPFSDRQIELVKTFADQAVIAIENVRLFTELQARNRELAEALEQQTATSEILGVISSSPTDVQPIFDAIARSASRLCGGEHAIVTRYDSQLLHLAAQHNPRPGTADETRRSFPRVPRRENSILARVFVDAAAVHVWDAETEELEPAMREAYRQMGVRAVVAVPMIHEGRPIGVVGVSRGTPGPFSDGQVALLKTFADQAVIAIENVRLFTELQARTQDLTRSVGQLTALGEVGRAVSSTLDLETVLSTIVSRAIQLSGTDGGSVYEYDEATEEFTLQASWDLPEAYVEQVRDTRPRKGEGAVGRVAQTREPVQIVDISDAAAYESRVRNMLLQIGLRALLAVPLIAEDRLVGALIVMRKRTGTFAAEEVALLQTFATQSALAIQNARLFREIEDKSRQLEVASQHKSEFLANMSHELRTPLNAIIGFSEVLSERMFGELNEKQEEYLKDIYASGTHLLSLINDILDLSKIEAGRMELELTDFHLPTALDSALTLVRERAGRRGIALHLSVDERLGQMRADERKVRQVVLNLLSNAIKFTPEGGRIEVLAAPKDRLVEVSVTDTGVGIAPADQEAVFEEFRQVGTAEKKVEGTGLGLTLCRKFVELHGGRIWVKSAVGVGSTFTFALPLTIDHRHQTAMMRDSAPRPRHPLRAEEEGRG